MSYVYSKKRNVSKALEIARSKPPESKPANPIFRSAVSGLWYANPDAAGDIDCVCVRDQFYDLRKKDGLER